MSGDPFDLARFVSAQNPVFEQIRRELRSGRKTTHWMWFVFPQIKGLGFSAMAQRYAIGSLDEARAYLSHSILGERLRDCTELVLLHRDKTVREVFGSPDDLKFHSSMTLFASATQQAEPFQGALHSFFNGKQDEATLHSLDG